MTNETTTDIFDGIPTDDYRRKIEHDAAFSEVNARNQEELQRSRRHSERAAYPPTWLRGFRYSRH